VNRRYDPLTGRCVNLLNLPADVPSSVAEKWMVRPSDLPETVDKRVSTYGSIRRDLEKYYGYRKRDKTNLNNSTLPPVETPGIIQEIDAEGVGEADGAGKQPSLNRVCELVQAILHKPLPVQIQ
jgi:hypothetical protein